MSVAKSKTAAQCIGDCINSLVTKARLNPQLAALAATGAAASLLGVAALAGCFQKRWDVTNKVFIITGASSGIGKALALQLVQMGAKVCLSARRENELNATVNECNAVKEGSATGKVMDVSIRSDNEALVAHTIEKFGRIDVLVLNAGISAGAPFEKITEEGLNSFESVTKTNYFGPVYATHYALPELIKNQGKVVVISSVFGIHGGPTRTFYAGSKFALHGFFESLRMELSEKGVGVHMICPGPVATDIARTRVGPDGKRATTGHFDMKFAITAERAGEHIIDALQTNQRLRAFSFGVAFLYRVQNLAPSFWDFFFVRSMKKLGMLDEE